MKPQQHHLVCVVFCMHMCSFTSLISRMPPLSFSNTAITKCHLGCTFFRSEHTEFEFPDLLEMNK